MSNINKYLLYSNEELDSVLADSRGISFLYSYRMDEVINSFLRKDGNFDENVENFINFINSKECKEFTITTTFKKKVNKADYCQTFNTVLKKISLYTLKSIKFDAKTMKTVLVPSIIQIMINISQYFKVKQNLKLYRVIVINKGDTLKQDVGFISTSLDPALAIYIFGYQYLSYQRVDEKDYREKIIYFYEIDVDKGTLCIPISTLGSIQDEQEILFTNQYTIKINKITELKEFDFFNKNLNKIFENDPDKKISFLKFLNENEIKLVHAKLINSLLV